MTGWVFNRAASPAPIGEVPQGSVSVLLSVINHLTKPNHPYQIRFDKMLMAASSPEGGFAEEG